MIKSNPVSTEEQVQILADLYSERAGSYDTLWSPVIRPVGERLLDRLPLSDANHVIDVGTGTGALLQVIQKRAPKATVLGVDRSEGMLRLAAEKYAGQLRVMDVQSLDLADESFDVAVIAFVLFHLPDPQRCLNEVARVLKPGGWVGSTTWAVEQLPRVNAIWDEELESAGARTIDLPATDNRARTDSLDKVSALMEGAGLIVCEAWIESIEHHWQPEAHFRHQVESSARARLDSLAPTDRDRALVRIKDRIAGTAASDYVFRGDIVAATATKGTHNSVPGRS